MRMRILQSVLGFVALATLTSVLAIGQTTSATVTGAVSDPNGAAIPGASVVLENLQTHVQATVTSNSSGFYRVSGLLPGFYRATVTKSGFKAVVRDGIELHGQDEVAINYNMQVGSVTESVTVTSAEPLLQSDSSTVSTVIETQQIENTPLNGRNVMNLSALTPGVVPQGATNGNPLNNQAAIGNYTNPAGWGNYQVGGAVTGQNITYVDGGPLNMMAQNWMGYIPGQDSIQEFRVETNNISAEYGGYYGGVLLFSTKSGTNDVHGSAYEYFRNTVLDANSYFNNQTGVVRPPVNQNQYGVSLGGPLKKNKLFLFGNWEGFVDRVGLPYQTVVPTVAETTGDFTADYSVANPLLNNLTQQPVSCNGVVNKVCPDPTALYMANGYKYWAQPSPSLLGAPHGAINFSTNAASGGSSNQYVIRSDYSLSPHQQLFARYTTWRTDTLGTNYYHNNVPQPEVLSTTQQAVVGDTITFNSTTQADIRASYIRFDFISQPPNIGKVDLSKFGPAYAAIAGQVTYNALPVPFLIGYGNQFPILIINVIQFYDFDKYALSGNITKTFGRHALKAGAEVMRNEGYFSGGGLGPDGLFAFVNGLPTNDVFANFMLGFNLPLAGLSGIQTSRKVSAVNYSQGYYVSDTYQVNPKLTLTGGIRWDLPGGVLEKHDVNTVLLPNIASPLGTIQNTATGQSQQLKGDLALVNTPAYPSRYDDVMHNHLFAPNLGFSARVLSNTVVRGGFGMSFISYTDFNGVPSPVSSPITAASTPDIGPFGGGSLSNPFPQINGVVPKPIGRNPAFDQQIQGLTISGIVAGARYPYVEQWNLNVQTQLSSNSVFQIGYQGSKGTHIRNSINLNQLPDNLAAQAATQYQGLVAGGATPAQADAQTFLNVQVANPLAGKLTSVSSFNGPTISKGQLLMPYPQFSTSVSNPSLNEGSSIYHSLQATYQVRFHSAGAFFAAYTWAKLIGNVDSTTGFLEGNTVGGGQDNYNKAADRSLESFDVPQRLVLNYSLALPFGKGQHFMANDGDALDRVIGGWRLSSVTSFQVGYPLALTAQANDLSNSFGAGGIRPNRVAGCNPKLTGGAIPRLNKWFNTACFAQPAQFTFGNEGRVDSSLRGEGVDNWDLSLSKDTHITERVHMMFEGEFINAFNRVQFGPPELQLGSSIFGVVSSTLNNPREIQFAARLLF